MKHTFSQENIFKKCDLTYLNCDFLKSKVIVLYIPFRLCVTDLHISVILKGCPLPPGIWKCQGGWSTNVL